MDVDFDGLTSVIPNRGLSGMAHVSASTGKLLTALNTPAPAWKLELTYGIMAPLWKMEPAVRNKMGPTTGNNAKLKMLKNNYKKL